MKAVINQNLSWTFFFCFVLWLPHSPFRFLGYEVIVDDAQDSVPLDSGTNNVGTWSLFHMILYAHVSFLLFRHWDWFNFFDYFVFWLDTEKKILSFFQLNKIGKETNINSTICRFFFSPFVFLFFFVGFYFLFFYIFFFLDELLQPKN